MNDTFALFFVTWAFISVTLFFVYVTLMKRCNVWGIERSGFFNGREKWAKGFENQRV